MGSPVIMDANPSTFDLSSGLAAYQAAKKYKDDRAANQAAAQYQAQQDAYKRSQDAMKNTNDQAYLGMAQQDAQRKAQVDAAAIAYHAAQTNHLDIQNRISQANLHLNQILAPLKVKLQQANTSAAHQRAVEQAVKAQVAQKFGLHAEQLKIEETQSRITKNQEEGQAALIRAMRAPAARGGGGGRSGGGRRGSSERMPMGLEVQQTLPPALQALIQQVGIGQTTPAMIQAWAQGNPKYRQYVPQLQYIFGGRSGVIRPEKMDLQNAEEQATLTRGSFHDIVSAMIAQGKSAAHIRLLINTSGHSPEDKTKMLNWLAGKGDAPDF